MTSTTPTVADEIARYLRTGDTDPYHAAWSAPSFLERAQRAGADLENALVTEVSQRANGWQPPPAMLAVEDLVAFTRGKIEPMVRGLFPPAEQDVVLSLVEKSVVFLTPSNIEGVPREARWPRSTWDLANLYLGAVGEQVRAEARKLDGTALQFWLDRSIDLLPDDAFPELIADADLRRRNR
jgi:hypothetical protein